ncbi:putative membrane protein [Peptoniphilus sp. ING2-D1G]|nr:putative membrane protein [Peptoniphilus sp. ING2-D1G]
MKKGDYLVIILVIFSSFFIFAKIKNENNTKGDTVAVYVDSQRVAQYNLKVDDGKIIDINSKYGKNKIKIEEGKVKMVDSTCKDKVCMHMKAIDANNETIICLPNRLVVKIESESSQDVDVILQ